MSEKLFLFFTYQGSLLISLLLTLCFPSFAYGGKLQVAVNAESAILINADTGAILYEKNADRPQYPASITKIATCLFALHALGNKLEDVVSAENDAIVTITKEAKRRSGYSIPAWWLEVNSSHIGIKKGEEMRLEDLLYGMMVSSGNDAANVIAQYVGGTIPSFLEEMNKYIKDLGCKTTTFYNPHGLHHPKHVTTARDMAIITREALQKEEFKTIVKTVRYTRPKTNKQQPTVLVQTNKLLRKGKFFYPKAIGVKTGYTSDAMNTLVAAAENDGRVLIAVLLKTKERDDLFKDAKKMFEVAFSQPKLEKVLIRSGAQKQKIKVPGGAKPLTALVEKDICLQFYPAEEPRLKCLLHLDEKLKAPIHKGELIGEIRLVNDEERVVKTYPVLAHEDVPETWSHWLKESLFPKRKEASPNGVKRPEGIARWKTLILFVVLGGGLFGLLFFYKKKRAVE
ncbi:D-alanyl-D-alanine carboxypeptidase family protein [Estrella lausannensis]|uniref:D-alanyl-D-alanine carboxypeptidase n=1 Tax=Estrella lausannensis TaxID=483423 RepID=A0A0H5DNE6_9BACT|nr:D-alanyl-D-alanine carboxypeptidase family protein [Estrella lausannensis]CRX37831.1 D-alanyl-D-alanine carboxypeptidase [Estrella lausannensis]